MAPRREEHASLYETGRFVLTGRGWAVVAIALVSLAVRAVLASCLDVFQDESIYWWQGHAGLTFTPHPPGVPMLIRLSVAHLGEGVLGLRALSLLAGTLSIFVVYLLARDLYSRRAGLWAAALFASCPFFFALGVLMTPDSLLIFLWLLYMWVTWRAAGTSSGAWWMLSGVVLAAGLFTKYMMVLAAPCALFALCWTREGRAVLRRREPWLALVLAAGLFLPAFVAWNWHNDWTSVRYHLAARHEWTLSFAWNALVYITGHAAAYSPVLCAGILAALVMAARSWRRGEGRGAWLFSFGVWPILFFLGPTLFTKARLSRVQWDETGYAAGLIAFAGVIAAMASPESSRFRRRAGVAALAFALVLTGIASIISIWPGPLAAAGIRLPTRRMLGWRELADHVRELEQGWQGERPIILAYSFRTAVCLGFHLQRRDGIYTLRHRRNVQYGLVGQLSAWGIDMEHMEAELGGREAVLIIPRDGTRMNRESDLGRVPDIFATARPLSELPIVRGGRTVRTFYLYRCSRQAAPRDGAEAP